MISFKHFLLIESTRYPVWAKGSAIVLAGKIRALSMKIKSETDQKKRLELIAQQNALLGYLLAGSILVNKQPSLS